MSTRCTVTFVETAGPGEPRTEHHVYQHGDGWPLGVATVLERTLPLTWPLPRFEAEHFAAAYIAASIMWHLEATGHDPQVACGHGMRLFSDWRQAADIEFHYEISQEGGDVYVTAWKVDCIDGHWTERRLYRGRLEHFKRWANGFEARQEARSARAAGR